MAKYEELKNGAIFGTGVKNPYGQFFMGETFLNSLAQSPDRSVSVGTVDFEPGSRNNWHIHTDGYQILLVTGGEGWYQEFGKSAQSLQAGDVVITDKGIKHWHGAKSDSWFEHIAVTAGNTEWFEAVEDAAYDAL